MNTIGINHNLDCQRIRKLLMIGPGTALGAGIGYMYLSFGEDELFLAGANSIRKRLEEYGVHVTVEIGEGNNLSMGGY